MKLRFPAWDQKLLLVTFYMKSYLTSTPLKDIRLTAGGIKEFSEYPSGSSLLRDSCKDVSLKIFTNIYNG